jgi:hypothetical protein
MGLFRTFVCGRGGYKLLGSLVPPSLIPYFQMIVWSLRETCVNERGLVLA